MKRLFQGNISDLSQQFQLPQNLKLAGIYIAFQGSNQSGQTLTLNELGQVQLLKNGEQIDLFDVSKMAYLNNIKGGSYPNVSGGQDNTFHLACYRPFNWDDENCLFTKNDKWEVIHNFPNATSTIVASGTVRYFGVLAGDAALQNYLLRFKNLDYSFSAAGTYTYQIPADNVLAILVENETYLTSINLTKDGKPFVENIEKSDLNGISHLLNKIETYSATQPYFLIDLNPSKENINSLSDSLEISFTVSGSCNVKTLVISQDMTPSSFVESASVRNAFIDQKAQTKSLKGYTKVAGAIQSEKF